MEKIGIFEELRDSIQKLDITTINAERKEILYSLIRYLHKKIDFQADSQLNFICTHNSRRSIFAQIWAQTLADFYNIENVYCFSGGTATTSVYPQVMETLTTFGFKINGENKNENPVYQIRFSDKTAPLVAFSKLYTHPVNPQKEFAAIMTCSDADKNCAFIAGAEKRVALPYEDPKRFDETLRKEEEYATTCKQIATEMKFVFSHLISQNA